MPLQKNTRKKYDAYMLGDGGDNVMIVDAAHVAIWEGLWKNFVGVLAYGGSDYIWRDQTGGYGPDAGAVIIGGGSGWDTIDYDDASAAMTIRLDQNWAQMDGTVNQDLIYSFESAHGSHFDDTIYGTDNADFLYGDHGDDDIHGLGGDDQLSGDGGNDDMHGGNGEDTMLGGDGNDQMHGGSGDDAMLGGAGNDNMDGGSGDDLMEGGDGDDNMWGDDGEDTLEGGAGNDDLTGGGSNDTLTGNDGDDWFWGGEGFDLITTGTGADVVVITENDVHCTDTITDFELGIDRVVVAELALDDEEENPMWISADMAGNATLWAHTATAGTQQLITFEGLTEAEVEGYFDSGALFDGGGGPGLTADAFIF